MHLPSQFQIGDRVKVFGLCGTVVAVCFTESKVYYDVDDGKRRVTEIDSDDLEAA